MSVLYNRAIAAFFQKTADIYYKQDSYTDTPKLLIIFCLFYSAFNLSIGVSVFTQVSSISLRAKCVI